MAEIKVIPKGEGKKVDLQGGSWSLQMVTSDTAGSAKSMLGVSTFKPGSSTEQMIHEEEEMCYILLGKGCLAVGNETYEYKEGEALYIPAGVPHGVHNTGEGDLVMVFVFSSPEYPPTSKKET